jgi:hypothetical protein
MAPDLPDDERAQRLNALRLGEIELSDAQREKQVLHAARGARHAGIKPTVRGVHDRLKGRGGGCVKRLVFQGASCYNGHTWANR